MYLLDADWVIQALANRQPALRILDNLAESPIYVSYVTVAEVYERAFTTVNPQAHLLNFRQFLSPYRMLTLTDPIVERFAEVRSFLRRRGQLIADFDILVGATALHHELTVLTFNRRDFQRIPDLKLYQPGPTGTTPEELFPLLARPRDVLRLSDHSCELAGCRPFRRRPSSNRHRSSSEETYRRIGGSAPMSVASALPRIGEEPHQAPGDLPAPGDDAAAHRQRGTCWAAATAAGIAVAASSPVSTGTKVG